MKKIFADLHIHIGRTQTGKPVKITGSKSLTLEAILLEAATRKGLGMVGIIDCHVPEVIAEIKQLIRQGSAEACPGGGVRYLDTTLILGTEMELYDEHCQGPIHVLCYFPSIEEMSAFSMWMSQYQKNITLSSQRSYVSARECQRKVKELEGLFIPAHIFTPFKSLYGKGVHSQLTEVFDPVLIDAVELGLSSDTAMADRLPELLNYTYITNSDAHSVSKIAREYQLLEMHEPDFISLKSALRGEGQNRIVANYGLNPKLGKYHLEVEARITQLSSLQQEELQSRATKRAQELAKRSGTEQAEASLDWGGIHSRERPPYIHQIPLEYIPNLGPKTLNKLLAVFGSEMNVIHSSTREKSANWVQEDVANRILAARTGAVQLHVGGQGKYGKVL